LTQEQAAELFNVSRDSIQKARRVEREASELVEPIKRGELTINAALRQVAAKQAPDANKGVQAVLLLRHPATQPRQKDPTTMHSN
jgi:hypothetical protein